MVLNEILLKGAIPQKKDWDLLIFWGEGWEREGGCALDRLGTRDQKEAFS